MTTERWAMTRAGQSIERMAALLRDVRRSGGKDRWSHLHSHGHSYSTVRSAVARGYLREPQSYNYELTADAAAFFTWHALWEDIWLRLRAQGIEAEKAYVRDIVLRKLWA